MSGDDQVDGDGSTDHDTVRGTWTDSGTLSTRVITTVAAATGAAPGQMQPLYEAIEPEALERLFERASRESRQSPGCSVSFRYEGCDVTVRADGRIDVSLGDGDRS